MDTNILLDSGTNELEILEFMLDGCVYGINVAKIREIIPYREVTPVPNSHPSIEGIFMPRDTMITAIDLRNCLGKGISEPGGMFIITNFNKLDMAFHVEAVNGIHRISWKDIIKPSSTLSHPENSVSTGIVKFEERLIVILDFEKIVTDINPETGLQMADIDELGERSRNDVPICVADDSPLLNKLICDSLKKAGYTNVNHFPDGLALWNYLLECVENKTLNDKVKCIISDIEMPEMDGHRLTKMVKENDKTKKLPVILFSSLINEEMRRKGESLGADAQLTKPEIGKLVTTVDTLIAKAAKK